MSFFYPGFLMLSTILVYVAAGQPQITRASAAIPFEFTSAPVPFPGPEPRTLPATLEAENFDRGGEGVGYHELTGTMGSGIYRNRPVEAVDIQAFSGASGGFVVTEASAGEWLSYTIVSVAAGSYELSVRYATELRSGVFHLEIDGQNVTGPMTITATGPNFRSLFKRVDLTAGQHTLRLVMDSNSIDPETGEATLNICNFDSIGFRALKTQLNSSIREDFEIFQKWSPVALTNSISERQVIKASSSFSLALIIPEIAGFDVF